MADRAVAPSTDLVTMTVGGLGSVSNRVVPSVGRPGTHRASASALPFKDGGADRSGIDVAIFPPRMKSFVLLTSESVYLLIGRAGEASD